MTNQPRLAFSDGHSMPQLGLGVWQVPADQTAAAVSGAIERGYRLIDGAFIYGNEAELGQGLRQSGINRREMFVTTKVWNADQGRQKARASVRRSLDAMGLDYLDLVLIHWPCPKKGLAIETWQALIDMRAEGLMRSIGVSNFNADHLDAIMAATGVSPVLNQIELNPRMQNKALAAANAARGIVTQDWTPMGERKSFDAPEIAGPARRAGKSPAQVILRWHLQLGHSVIPRAVRAEHQAENLAVFDFSLSEPEMAALAELDWNSRCGPDPLFFEVD